MKKLKMNRFLGLVLATVLLFTSIPLVGMATTESNSVIASGTCGSNAYWTLYDSGLIEISGSGYMDGYSSEDYYNYGSVLPWKDYRENIEEVIVSGEIKNVGNFAFDNCSNLKDVKLGDNVIRIDNYAFSRTGITDSPLTENIQSVGECAFLLCGLLDNVSISKNLTSIGEGAFSGCSKLSKIIVNEENTKYSSQNGVLYSKDGSSIYTYPANLSDTYVILKNTTNIAKLAFGYCYNLKEIQMPDSIVTINEGAFINCESVSKIVISENVTTIGQYAFCRCYNLEEIYFKGDLPSINTKTFENVTANIYYPVNNNTWIEDALQNYGGTITWKKWNPETGEIIDDSQNIEDSDETDGFSITSGLGYGRYCIIGNEIKLMGSYTASDGNAEEEAKAIKWSSNNPDIAEIIAFSCDLGSKKVSYDLTVKGHKAGIATITGIAEDGRSVSFEISVEPELQFPSQSDIYSSSSIVINESGDVECSVQLTEPDAEYLENFISKVSMKITDDDDGAAYASKRSYEVAEDGLSAKSILSIVANYDGKITLKITSEYGQEITGYVWTESKYERPGISDVEKEDGLAFYDEPYYSKGAKEIVWKNGMYTQSEITVRLKLTYNPTEDTGKSSTINRIKFSLDNLDMFKIDGQDEIYPDIKLSPGEEYTCYATLVKRGMFWKKPQEGTTEVGTITAEVEGDFPSMEINKKYSLEVHVTTEKQEEESSDNTEEDQELEQEVNADAEVAIDAFENIADKIALDSRLTSCLGKNQSSALELILFSEIALVNMSKHKWTEAGFSDQVVEKVMDKFLGDWKPEVGIQIKDIPVSVIVKSENHGNVQCDFVCHLSGFTLNNSTFGVSGSIDTQLTFIDEDNRIVTLALGTISDCDIKKFTDAAWDISSKYLKQGYNDVLGNQVNKWIGSLKNNGIDKIASMAAPYGLKKPVEKLLEKLYDKKLKDKLDTFTILCYPATQSVAQCPVDVYIYDLNGTLAGSIENDEVTLCGNDMALWTVGDDKYVQLFNRNYKIIYKSTDQGSMDLEVYDQSDGSTDLIVCKFNDVPLKIGLEYTSDISDAILVDSSTCNLVSNEGKIVLHDSVEYMGALSDKDETENIHNHKYVYIDNRDGTHKGICENCNLSIIEEHIYVAKKCICGAEEQSSSTTDLSTCTMTVPQSAYTYTGKAITPTVTITDGANILKEGTDYTVTYTGNINVGTATVTATGQGSYTGSLNTTFTISKASQKVKASIDSSTIRYGGKSSIKASGIGKLTYTSDNTKVAKVDSKGGVTAGVPGKAVITIKAAGDENHKSAKTTLTITVKYAITYKLNGGTNAKSNPAFYDSTTATIKLANPTRTGYTFKGWYSDSKFKTKVTSIKKGSTGNKTLYAKWSANTYTIKFNGNGAKSGSMASKKSLKYGTSYTLPANAFKAKNGYTFNGWNTKADGSGKSYANKANVKNLTSKNGGTVTLYAQWKKVKYTIAYKLNGGTNAKDNPSSYYVTTSTIKLANPTRTGYTFEGWYSDSKFKTKVTSIAKGSTGNRTLYAKWSANTYTIKFNGNGAKSGSMASKKSLKYGTSYTLPANAFKAKNGYAFNGWNTKADGSGESYANKASVKNLTSKNGGTVTLYAQWKKVKYTITYELNGGTNAKGNPSSYYVTTSTIRLEDPSRTGYTFEGWYSDSSYKTNVTEIAKGSTGNKTLYAKWAQNPAVDLKNCTVTLSKTSYTYDGTAKEPSVTVQYGTKILTEGKDYTITYADNINAGTGTVTVVGKDQYTGSVKKSFSIKMPSKPVTVWDGTIASSFYYGAGTKENPYVIASADELAYLAKTVNEGKKYTGKYFVLENDIILNETDNFEAWSEEIPANEWIPIGIGTDIGFNGTLNGQGHIISGLYINTDNVYAGLFGYVLSGADISNLSLKDSYVSIYSGSKACAAGCLASYSQGMIYDCEICGYCELRFSCVDKLEVNGGVAAGCFVGCNEGTVFECTNAAEGKMVLKDGQYFCYEGGGGGIVGVNERTVNSCQFTGILEIEKINTAEAQRADYIGSIVGDNNSAGAIVNCQNSGTMVIREELKSRRQDSLYPGGICGSSSGIVQNCCNQGQMSIIIQVTSSSYSLYGRTGGIAAANYGYVENCFSTETAFIQGYQSMETGSIAGNNSSDGLLMNCYWKKSDITAAGENSGIITECEAFIQQDGKNVLEEAVLGTNDLTKTLNTWITEKAGDSGFSRYRKWAEGDSLPVFSSFITKDNVYTAVKIPADRCGDHITWSLKNGVLTLNGSGDMYNYSYGRTPWYNQKDSVKKVVIENGITSIGNWAFLECKYLEQINIPDSVKSIGSRSFQSCNSLTELEIPISVEIIYAEAFFDCENILKIVFYNASIEFGDSYMSDGDLGIENKDTCVLYGYENSTVQEYANEFGYRFEIIV